MISDDYIPIDVYILIGVITGAITYTQFDTTAPTETTPSEQNSYLSQLPSISSINPFSEDTKSATPLQNTQSVPESTVVPNTESVPESPPVVPNAVPVSDEPIKSTNNTTGTEPIMNIGGKRKQRKTKHRKQRKNKKKSFKRIMTKN